MVHVTAPAPHSAQPAAALPALVTALGLASLLPYLYLLRLGDLGGHRAEYGASMLVALALYLPAVALVARFSRPLSHRSLALIFGFGIAFRAVTVLSVPQLSDDMFRYIWDGRVQAQGISPYAYPPAAPELAPIRDDAIWPRINRRGSLTVYPAGAELAFAALWRVLPDRLLWFQARWRFPGYLQEWCCSFFCGRSANPRLWCSPSFGARR